MSLEKYHSKRKFPATPEPKGEVKKSASKKLAFVIQEHRATRLHYDFRLEMDGVLKSWAVPKGPSMDPHEHHLAVPTEDHPFEYRKFEGVIPEGHYGAGEVIIWDAGWYEARKGEADDSEKTLLKEYKKGHLTFILHGKKLHGEFALIKIKGRPGEKDPWLLVKKGDEFATTKDITKQATSVKSGKTISELKQGANVDLGRLPKISKPWQVTPMLCTLVEEPFSKPGWIFEIKWDGFRAIGTKHGAKTELYSRNNLDFREKFAAVNEALQTIKADAIVDGEIVVVDAQGMAHFDWMQNHDSHLAGAPGYLQYHLFDILWLNGHDLRSLPLTDRKQLLKSIVPKSEILKYSDHVENEGLKFFKAVRKEHIEGMVAKRADSAYQENVRGMYWQKIKTHLRQEVVIGGYTEPRGGRKYIGSLMVGVYKRGKFVYVGHSGGGIPDEQRRLLQEKLAKLEQKTSPFSTEPKPNAPVHWVRPKVVAEMSFSQWTSDGYMRHPIFLGLREDKKATEVIHEKPKSAFQGTTMADAHVVPWKDLPFEPTHLDKIFFPKYKYTKGDMFKYYESVADYMLPYLNDRPCSLNRMPSGISGESFFQKNNEHLPSWVPHANIFSDSNNADIKWIVGKDLPTLLYMVQLGCVEINPWNSRAPKLKHPDWIVIDLDPEGVTFNDVIDVAQTVKQVCDEWGVTALAKTSGKTGIHIYIPMGAKYTTDQGRNFAHLLVIEVNKRQPKITSIERKPEKRKHKIYLDYLQNRDGQTLAAPYSLRPTPEATVSMPLDWNEIKHGLKPTDFTIKNALPRLKHNGDIWKPILGKGIDLNKILQKIHP